MDLFTFADVTGMFGLNHILALIFSVVIIVAGSILSIKYLKVEHMHKILLGVGIVSESLKVISYILNTELKLGGYLPKTDLPFHLCSIQIIFILILNFSKNEKLKHLLHSFMIPTCLVGGIAAIILATASSRSMPVVLVQYFGFHSAITVFAIYLLANKDIEFTLKDYRNTLIMLCATLIIAIYINSILYFRSFDLEAYQKAVYKASEGIADAEFSKELFKDWLNNLSKPITQLGAENGILEADYWKLENINFMYVVNPPQEGLPYLAKYPLKSDGTGGWLVYLIHYAFLAFVVVSLTFIKPIVKYFKSLKKPAKAG